MAGKQFLRKVASRVSPNTLWVKNFVEIALSRSVSEINTFLYFMQKFKMAAKSGEKLFLRKVARRLCRYLVCQKFCRNCSISLRFRDKHVFAFNAEIQGGRQKWRENDFCEKSPIDSADTLQIKFFYQNQSILLCFRDKCVCAFNAEI